MTNLVAAISFVLVTNWTTVSVTSPVMPETSPGISDAVYRGTMSNQHGIIVSNTVATVRWKSNSVPVILESVPIADTYRSIDLWLEGARR